VRPHARGGPALRRRPPLLLSPRPQPGRARSVERIDAANPVTIAPSAETRPSTSGRSGVTPTSCACSSSAAPTLRGRTPRARPPSSWPRSSRRRRSSPSCGALPRAGSAPTPRPSPRGAPRGRAHRGPAEPAHGVEVVEEELPVVAHDEVLELEGVQEEQPRLRIRRGALWGLPPRTGGGWYAPPPAPSPRAPGAPAAEEPVTQFERGPSRSAARGRLASQPPTRAEESRGVVRSRPDGPETEVLQRSRRIATASPAQGKLVVLPSR